MRVVPNLDFLRSFAVICVILDHAFLAKNVPHAGPLLFDQLGLMGVFLFFVHTCLVLMWSLERKPKTLDFYIRRGFRIYPLAMLAVTVTLLFRLPLTGLPPHFFYYPNPSHQDMVANFFLVQNLIGHNKVLGVLWSLPLEVDMYVLLPILFFFVQKNFKVWLMLLLWGLSVGLCHRLTADGATFPTVVPCFLPGVLAYVLFGKVAPRLPGWTFPLFLAMLSAAFLYHPSIQRSWSFCLVLGLGLPFFRQITWRPLVRASHEGAKYSYGFYLGHPFALYIAFDLLGSTNLVLQISVLIAGVLGIAITAYHLIEKPFIDMGSRVAGRVERRYEAGEIAGSF